MLETLKDTQKDIEFLNKECLSRTPFTLEKQIKGIIENELRSKEIGYIRRIEVLENILVIMKQSNIFKDFEDSSSKKDKLKQAMKIY